MQHSTLNRSPSLLRIAVQAKFDRVCEVVCRLLGKLTPAESQNLSFRTHSYCATESLSILWQKMAITKFACYLMSSLFPKLGS